MFTFIESILVCCVSLFLFFCTSILFKRIGIVDKPDGVRKIHEGEVPLSGGLAFFISFLIISFFIDRYFIEGTIGEQQVKQVLFISAIILFLGLWDDVKPLPTSVRLIVQIFASWLVIIITDVYLLNLGDLLGFGSIYLGSAGIPLTIFMVVGVCNAFNMIDGMDGSVGIILLVLSTSISSIAYLNNAQGILFFTPIITIVFLFFNLGWLGKKWKIFLGDSGSTWIGFFTAWTLIIMSQGEMKIFQPVSALWFILVPLIDALSTFLSRIWNRKSMFVADRTHIHHMLLDAGLKRGVVLLIILLISVISAGFGIFANLNSVPESEQFFGFLTMWFFYYLLVKYPLAKKNVKRL
ncbi:undecaprenyl/decaprenyl-phosphate alpha-N-acetylglucosaminyl 1-phosphate transferase [Gammaproteobacteria bacterium]|nr:undecaprenyl/decaprenyl-phosphate alpha-N-acetylglucosaminyl 1-phosphate transferase [Gammaproteobacteria bacterium]